MSAKKNLVVDVVALAVYLVLANPVLTGIPLHEWLSVGLFIVFLVHVVAHAQWVADAIRNMRSTTGAMRGNLVLDALILLAFVVVMLAGFGTSGEVLRAFGYYVDGYYFWNPLHAIAAKVLLALLLVHVVVHVKWLGQMMHGKRDVPDRRPHGVDDAAPAKAAAEESEGQHVL